MAAVRTLGIPVHRRFGLPDGRLVMPTVSLQMEAKAALTRLIHAILEQAWLVSFSPSPGLLFPRSSRSHRVNGKWQNLQRLTAVDLPRGIHPSEVAGEKSRLASNGNLAARLQAFGSSRRHSPPHRTGLLAWSATNFVSCLACMIFCRAAPRVGTV